MSNINKLIKEGIKNLLETKGFEEMEVAFGTKKDSDLSKEEKNQFGPMGNLKDQKGGNITAQGTIGLKTVEKANKENNSDAEAYYKEVAKKVKDYQTPNDKEKFDAPKVDTNTKNEDERLEVTGYDVGVSGMEVTADLAAEKGGSEEVKAKFKERIKSDDPTAEKMMKNAKKTNVAKYDKEENNTRPVKAQKSPQPMGENVEYKGVDAKNIFKANGKLVSEEQVMKLANKVPSRIKIDETTFAITDGENTYRLIWEGDSKNGEAVITHHKNSTLVKEDIEKMKKLWGFKSSDSISTKKNITESGEDAFKRMLKLVKENVEEVETEEEEEIEENLKGGQKKLDKNKNNKLDSEDFKMLRGEKRKK